MAQLDDPDVEELLSGPNYAVVTTVNEDGSLHSCIVWVGREGPAITLNSNTDRIWPRNLAGDPRATVLIFASSDPYHYVEIRGTTETSIEGAKAHIDELAKKYIGADAYPYLQPGEQRVKVLLRPDRIRLYRQ
jgi:PPOX class probable F420-dependent enzyme